MNNNKLLSVDILNENQFTCRYLNNKGSTCFMVKELDFTKTSKEVVEDIISFLNLINNR